VVTQRIANPLSPIENIRFFLAKTALRGRNGWRTCKTFAAGAAVLALAACAPSKADISAAENLGALCVKSGAAAHYCRQLCEAEFATRMLGDKYRRERIACIVSAHAAAPDPAPELAGGREAAP
jgi:hypothetical protein